MRSVNFRLKSKGYLLPIALLAIVSGSSRAAEADPLKFVVGQGVTFGSNFFRLPEGVNPSAVATGVTNPPRSETVFKTYAGMDFDKSYSRQRLRANFVLTHYGYQTYTYLDFNGISGRAEWDWAIGDRWSGTPSYDRTQTPSNDATQTGFQTAYQLYQRFSADANYRWHPDWSVGAGLGKVSNNYNRSLNAFSDYSAEVADARLTYRPSIGNRIALLIRRTDGNYSNRVLSPTSGLAQSYTKDDYEADAEWALNGHSRVFVRVGYSSIRYGALALRFRDFDGPAGRLAYDWSPTAKTTVSLVLSRDIGSELPNNLSALQDNLNASFVATSAASIAASSALSPRISVRGLAEFWTREHGGETGAFGSVLRNPNYAQYTLSGTWTPKRSLLFSVRFGHETRTGNNPAFPHYDDKTVSADLQFLFQ
jgi:exopolysaccharide biosynthesis operon protein EpsL